MVCQPNVIPLSTTRILNNWYAFSLLLLSSLAAIVEPVSPTSRDDASFFYWILYGGEPRLACDQTGPLLFAAHTFCASGWTRPRFGIYIKFWDHLTRLFRFTCLASIQNLTIDHVKKEAQQVLWDVEGFGVNRSEFVMLFVILHCSTNPDHFHKLEKLAVSDAIEEVLCRWQVPLGEPDQVIVIRFDPDRKCRLQYTDCRWRPPPRLVRRFQPSE